MKNVLLISTLLVSSTVFGQHQAGFQAQEARDLIRICNSFSYLELYGSDQAIIPVEYQRVYTSPTWGMDNKFQVYVNQNNTKAVIHFRGSTDKKASWLENMYSSLVPARDTIVKGDSIFLYTCAEDPEAAIHAGYLLGMSYFINDVVDQIRALNQKGIFTIYITGHSQGGALAQMTRAYLNFLPDDQLNPRNKFKVYAFANPMIGNIAFAKEYERRFATPGFSFLIHNPDDIVPKMPLSYNDTTFWKSNLQNLVFDRESFHMKESAADGFMNLLEKRVIRFNNFFSDNIFGQLTNELGAFKMPEYRNESNYMHTSTPILVPPTEYPLELKDSSILLNDSLMRIYKRDEQGVFEDKSVYKKQSSFLQHKAYNYYTAVLKIYFPETYQQLDQKYFVLPEKNQ